TRRRTQVPRFRDGPWRGHDRKKRARMFSFDELGRANSVRVAFGRLFHHMELSRHQQSAVMFRENLPLNDSAIARIAVSPWRVILRAFYLRPIERRVANHLSEESVQLLPPMQFPDHDKRMLIELLRDLANDRCG